MAKKLKRTVVTYTVKKEGQPDIVFKSNAVPGGVSVGAYLEPFVKAGGHTITETEEEVEVPEAETETALLPDPAFPDAPKTLKAVEPEDDLPEDKPAARPTTNPNFQTSGKSAAKKTSEG